MFKRYRKTPTAPEQNTCGFTQKELKKANREFNRKLLTPRQEKRLAKKIERDLYSHKKPGHISIAGAIPGKNNESGIIWK